MHTIWAIYICLANGRNILADLYWKPLNTWAEGSAGATELENGPDNVLQWKEYNLAGKLLECNVLPLQHFLWDLGKALKYIWVWNASFVKENNKIFLPCQE